MSDPDVSPMLIIFDVDGTLLDANTIDYACFDRAFYESTGMRLTASQWSAFDEVTAQAIVAQALGKDRPDLAAMEVRIREAYLARLRESHGLDPRLLCAFAGTRDMVSMLRKSPEFSVAIATGCWRETAHFKLTAARFDFADIPFACSSDCYGRAGIISLAAERAGVPVERSIYVGDGLWDLKAARELGIPFIGTGRKVAALREAGARHTVVDLNHEALLAVVRTIVEERGRA